jgi:hypothetical protein
MNQIDHSALGKHISGKSYAFFGDTDHDCTENFDVMFSVPVLETLAATGYKHVMIEYSDKGDQCYVDAVANGRITPDQYLDIRQDLPQNTNEFHQASRYHGIPDYVAKQHDLRVAEGAKIGSSVGLKIHLVNSQEGRISPKNQLRYFFIKASRNQAWLDFVLKYPDYFENPQKLLLTLIHQHSDRYAKKGIDLVKTLTWDTTLTDQQRIYGFWDMEFGRKEEKKEMHRIAPKPFVTDEFGSFVNEQAVTNVIDARQKQDINVRKHIDRLRAGQPAAIFYGAAHIRNKFGGLSAGLKAEEFSCIHLIGGEKIKEHSYNKLVQDLIDTKDMIIISSPSL